jgi:hypothetical protein
VPPAKTGSFPENWGNAALNNPTFSPRIPNLLAILKSLITHQVWHGKCNNEVAQKMWFPGQPSQTPTICIDHKKNGTATAVQ